MAAWSWVGCDSPSKITAHKTIKPLPTRRALLAGGYCDAVDNEKGGEMHLELITI